MSLTLKHLTASDEAAMRTMVDQVLRLDKKTGVIIESKTDARQTGFSLHVKFEKKSDPFTTAEMAKIHDGAPDKLFLILRKLLDLPDGYDPDEK